MKRAPLNTIIAIAILITSSAIRADNSDSLAQTEAPPKRHIVTHAEALLQAQADHLMVPTSEITDLSADYSQGIILFHVKDRDFIYRPNFEGSPDHITAMYYSVSEILRANKIDILYLLNGTQKEPNLDKDTKRIFVSDLIFIYK